MQEHIPFNQQYYDARFGSLSQQLNEEEKRRWQVLSAAIESQKLPSELQIGDFGCGRGWLSHFLGKYGQITGFDLSEKAIENARVSFPAVRFEQLNAEDELPSEFLSRFDLLVSSEVIEHTDNQLKYLENACALLRAGGLLILSTPNGKWKNDFYREGRETWMQPLENWRNGEELSTMLATQGFSLLSSTSFNSEWHFDFRPQSCGTSHLSHPLSRKILKLTGQYLPLIAQLNKNNYGLNLLIVAEKK